MTGQEILQLAETHTEDDTIEPTLALKAINECLIMKIGRDAGVTASTVITAQEDVWAALPANLLEIYEIEKQGLDHPYFGSRYGKSYLGIYEMRDSNIRFPEAGTYTIRHYIVPPVIATLSDTPAVHELFHYPISFWVAARHKLYDDEENLDAKRLINEFQAAKNEAVLTLAKLRPTTRPTRKIRNRGWS